MTEMIRAPFVYTELREQGLTEEQLANLGFRHGYRVERDVAEEVAEQNGLAADQLLANPEDTANQRFKVKLRGNLASYLFEYDGAFRFSAAPDHMRILGLEKSGDTALPVRITDALLLERKLYQVIARAKHLLAELDSKLAASQHSTVFKDQPEPGRFKPRATYRQSPNGLIVEGKQYKTIKEISVAYGVRYEQLRRAASALGTPINELTDSQWCDCIERITKGNRK
jgi:hypothetical protein